MLPSHFSSSTSLHVKLDGRRITSPLHQQLPSTMPGRRLAVVSCSAQFHDTKVEDVLIVGGGIAGIATALALHKMGIKSRVLEQSPTLRVTGTALAVWTNGWHALEALGLADSLRDKFVQLSGFQFYSATDDKCLSNLNFSSGNKHVELRAVERRVLLETLMNELPPGVIVYDSRVSKLHRSEGSYPQIELKNGSTLQAKVLVGCDGIGSVVARDLGFKEAHYAGYIGIRGLAMFPDGHSFPNVLKQMLGRGVRIGCLPLDSNRVYWFLVFNRPPGTKIVDTSLIKQEALQLVNGWPEIVVDAIKRSPPETLSRSAISDRWMWPWTLPKLHRNGVTVAGDAMHPVTPNLAQGGCSALEDGVVLGRVLSKTLNNMAGKNLSINDEMKRIEFALDEYTQQRQQRMFSVAVQANLIGKVLQVEGELICSLRDTLLPGILTVDTFIKHSLYDVGALV